MAKDACRVTQKSRGIKRTRDRVVGFTRRTPNPGMRRQSGFPATSDIRFVSQSGETYDRRNNSEDGLLVVPIALQVLVDGFFNRVAVLCKPSRGVRGDRISKCQEGRTAAEVNIEGTESAYNR